jgi:crotonobetainyl-CoA:carnitine CoA-transferase CaiB-like acyl-CoA transferase
VAHTLVRATNTIIFVPAAPLRGIRVLDVTSNIAGPSVTMILAALGADVIKIERPGCGDEARDMQPQRDGWGAYFVAINRGKRSIAIDLSRPEGIALVLGIATRCEVFVENFRGGKAEAMGLGESAVRSARPDIIYASLSAFGSRGPDFDRPGYDALVQARTGIQSVTGEPGTAGARSGVSVLDMGSGMWMALGIIAALFERQPTGRGTRVDGSLYQTGIQWMAYHLISRQMTGVDPQPQGTRIGAFAPYGDYPTADSRILIGISNDRLFARLADALSRPDLSCDPRFATNDARVRHRDALDTQIGDVLATRSSADWLAHFDRLGIPASAIQTTGQVLEDPQLAALEQMNELAELPGMFAPLLPLEFGGEAAAAGAVPRLGQHTNEILTECGLSQSEIDHLVERKIIGCPPQHPPIQKNSS